jgi:hypothetical protein
VVARSWEGGGRARPPSPGGLGITPMMVSLAAGALEIWGSLLILRFRDKRSDLNTDIASILMFLVVMG